MMTNIADIKCFTCGKRARFFDIYREHYYCEDCTQNMLEEQVERGYRREELIAFETFICPFCGSRENHPFFFTPEDDNNGDVRFFGVRKCGNPRCDHLFIQDDSSFLRAARIKEEV
jgi:hypothetical protein